MPRLLCVLILFSGCGGEAKDAREAPAKSSEDVARTQNEALEAWRNHVRAAKQNEEMVRSEYVAKQLAGSGALQAAFAMEWLSDDVRKSESLTSPFVGEISVRKRTYTRYMRGIVIGSTVEFVLQFRYEGGKWSYWKGTYQVLTGDFADETPQPYVKLNDEVAKLFQ